MLAIVLVATSTAILPCALRYVFDVTVFDPFGMEKPRNVNTADSTGNNLQNRVWSYKVNEAFSIRNWKIMAVTPIRFPSLSMPAVLFVVVFKRLVCIEGKRMASLHSRGVLDEEVHHVLKAKNCVLT